MTTFWKNLHGLAQGQLFNGGYLAPPAAAALAANDQAARNGAQGKGKECSRRQPWPRLAAYR